MVNEFNGNTKPDLDKCFYTANSTIAAGMPSTAWSKPNAGAKVTYVNQLNPVTFYFPIFEDNARDMGIQFRDFREMALSSL